MAAIVHSKWGASGFSRIIACNGVIRQTRNCENTSNPAAELGTAAHELGEFALRLGVNAFDCLDLTFNNHVVDAAMADAAQLYVAFIRNIAFQYNVSPMLEVRVTMSSVGEDVFGTADCIFIVGDTIHVYDYKHGYGIVEVENNAQATFYAVATLDTYNLWGKVKRVVTGIIQPRADHVDGAIRTHEYTIDEMKTWQKTFADTVEKASNPNAPLNAGEHCKYCLASSFCRPRIMRTINLVYGEKPIDELNEEEIITMFNEVTAIRRNCDKIETRALELARSGKAIEGYKLVKAIARAKCEKPEEFVKKAIENPKNPKNTVKKEDFYNLKLKSMTDCKKIVNHSVVNEFFVKPPEVTVLAKMTDKRAAISTRKSAAGRFKPVALPSAVGKFKNITEKNNG